MVPPTSLESLPRRQAATVATIDWALLAEPEARRLRELGFDEGVSVEVLHPRDARTRADRMPDRADDGGAEARGRRCGPRLDRSAPRGII